MPSMSESAWLGLNVTGQLSQTSPTPSLSRSDCSELGTDGQLSAPSQTPSPSASWLTCSQPLAGLQESSVQGLPSSQFGGGPTVQLPAAQASFVVQAVPSLQGAVLFACTQPLAGLQESSVQTLPSSQFGGGPPAQLPVAQASFVVQALPSLQGAVLFAWTQPLAGLQESFVQTLPSSQFGGGPPAQLPAAQASFVVQALPSLQGAGLCVWTQALAGVQ